MIPAVRDRAALQALVDGFVDQGYAHITGAYEHAQVEALAGLCETAFADWRFASGTTDHPEAVGGLLERYPRTVFPALTNPLLLGFAEAVMGPFVQLDSAVVNVDLPVSKDQRGVPVQWHRDRFGSVPPDLYLRPASIVLISYLQDMTDEVGPLRVLPGSHRQGVLVPEDERDAPLPGEVLVRTQPGDVVALHHNLLHSGTRNTSGGERRFFGFIYQLSVLKPEDNFAGPNCRALIDSARRTRDRRLLRLLGEDPLVFPRQNSGFTSASAEDWDRWHQEDVAFAAEAAEAAGGAQAVRSRLAQSRTAAPDGLVSAG